MIINFGLKSLYVDKVLLNGLKRRKQSLVIPEDQNKDVDPELVPEEVCVNFGKWLPRLSRDKDFGP